MATEREGKPKWRITVRKVVLDWLRCRGMPESALVDFQLRKGRAEVVLDQAPETLTEADSPR